MNGRGAVLVRGSDSSSLIWCRFVSVVSGVVDLLAWRMRCGEDGSCANGGCFVVMVLRELVHEHLRCCHGFLAERRWLAMVAVTVVWKRAGAEIMEWRRCCFPTRWWRRLKMVALLQRERRGAVVLMVAAVTGAWNRGGWWRDWRLGWRLPWWWKERRKIRVRVSWVRWRRWWRGKIWLVNLVSGGLWHVACSGWLILKGRDCHMAWSGWVEFKW